MKKERKPRNPDEKLGFGKLLAWKSSDVSAAAVNLIINNYMLIFCTNVLGLDALKVGTILLVANIIDAITDLIAGYVVDSMPPTRFGKGRPWDLCILGVSILTIILFCTPSGASESFKYVFVFVLYNLIFGVFNTMRGAGAWPYEVRAFGTNRTKIAKLHSFGGFVTMFASIFLNLMFPRMFKLFGSDTAAGLSAAGWRTIVLVFLVPLSAISICRFIFVKEDPEIDAGQQALKL